MSKQKAIVVDEDTIQLDGVLLHLGMEVNFEVDGDSISIPCGKAILDWNYDDKGRNAYNGKLHFTPRIGDDNIVSVNDTVCCVKCKDGRVTITCNV